MSRTRYRTMAADPAWPYKDQLSMSDVKRSSASQYSTMTVEDICALGSHGTVAGFETMPDAFLWLWVTNPILLDGTGARVCRAWGFKPSQLVTWIKGRLAVVDAEPKLIAHIGMGHLTRGATEHLMLATRGTTKALLKNKKTPNCFIAPRTAHSTKPQAAYDLIEQLTPGEYVELFARKPRENWQVWGNEVAVA
jgi:N6-adenosine-specific RNA methylase IME4